MSDLPLVKRLQESMARIGRMCSEDRPPKMSEKWRVWLSRRLLLHSKLLPDQAPDVTPNPAGHSATERGSDG